MKIENILFDLDGTLTNPAEGITGSVRYALEKLGRPVPAQAELEKFIGPPLDEAFRERSGLGRDETQRAIGYFREYFAQKGIFQNELFVELPGLLRDLRQAGRGLYVATSKPTVFAADILARFEMAGYFEDVCGSPLDHVGCRKADVISRVLEQNDIPASTAVMVGDRKHDVLGAKEHGMRSVGVLYGFGDRQELEEAGADYIARDAAELREILLYRMG